MTTIIKTKRGLNLTLKQAEYIYSSLDLKDNLDSLAEQRYIRLKVSQIYEAGRDDVNQNRWKAKKYLTEATSASVIKHRFFSSETVFTILGFYTVIRVQLTRLNNLLKLNFIAKAFLNRLFGIAGFSYFLEFGYELFLTIKVALQSMPPETSIERQSPLYKRIFNRCKVFFKHFSNALEEEEGRKNRMLNCLVWGTVNLVLFFVSFGWSYLLNIAGFFFDVCNAYHKRSNIVGMHTDLLSQVTHKIEELEEQKSQLTKRLQEKSNSEDEINQINNEIRLIENNLQQFEYEKLQIAKKTDKANSEKRVHLLTVSLILLGVIFTSIPGLNIAIVATAAVLLVAVTAFVTVTRSWEILEKIGKFLKKTYENYKNPPYKPTLSENNLVHLHGQTHSSLRKIKEELESNIQFLNDCKQKIPESHGIAETFTEFTSSEVQTIRRIFNLTDDHHWKKQLKYLIKHANEDIHMPHCTSEKLMVYRCSFKKFLEHRIQEDKAFEVEIDKHLKVTR